MTVLATLFSAGDGFLDAGLHRAGVRAVWTDENSTAFAAMSNRSRLCPPPHQKPSSWGCDGPCRPGSLAGASSHREHRSEDDPWTV